MIAKTHRINFNDIERRPSRVLIVDDEQDILDSMKDIIEMEAPYEVEIASDIFSARQVADDFKPDIVLLDVQLGNSIGLSLIPPFKEQNPDVICIVMTAYREADYAATAVRNGADDYLFKPLDPENLLATLARHLEKQSLVYARKEADRRFHAVFEQTYQMLMVLDVDGHILEANNTVLEFGGWSLVEVGGKLFIDLPCMSNQKTSEAITAMLNTVQQGEIAREKNIELQGKTGKAVMDVVMKPVTGDRGEVRCIIFEGHDVTERRAAEVEISQFNIRLEALIKKRTIELEKSIKRIKQENAKRKMTEASLRIAVEEAVHANEFKTIFLSRISHELRTPMNAVLGFGQLLEQEPLSEEQADYLSKIMNAGDHLLVLIDEVLNISKIEAGQVNIKIEEFVVSDVINQSIKLIKVLADTKGLTVSAELTGHEDVLVNADHTRLKEVLVSFLSNAVKYNRINGSIKLTCKETSPEYFRINVEDTGNGLNKEQQRLAFEPFNRLGMECSDEKGTGIGLGICKKLAELMNGRIGVESQVGEGSTFWVEIPVAVSGRG